MSDPVPPREAILEQQAFYLLQEAAARLMDELHVLLRPHGLSPVQFQVLRVLADHEPDGLRCTDIALHLTARDPDITRLLDRLEQRDLIQRFRCDKDRRAVYARLTPAGNSMFQQLCQEVQDLHLKQFERLTSAQAAELQATLQLLGMNPHQKA